jgi:hypothetical protein
MNTIIENRFAKTFTAAICSVLISATCMLSAIGPARADTGTHEAPVVRPLA